MNRPVAEWMGGAVAASGAPTPLAEAIDPARYGGKAANLARMIAAGLPVPEGMVLGIEALDAFLVATGLDARLKALHPNAADPHALSVVEAQVRSWFETASWPEPLAAQLERISACMVHGGAWAVRSSAVGEDGLNSSCAGLMASVLHVRDRARLESAIKQVWASRWSARALAYEQTHGKLGGIAVVLQRQIDPLVAGVLFTRSPEPDRFDQMLCEYGGGLADRLVAGETLPTRMHIDRTRLAVSDRSTGEDGAELAPLEVRKLAGLALGAERLFDVPQDIEFAIDRDATVWIVQSRPITVQVRGRGARVVWSNANVNENFPDPISPLLYSIVAPGYSAYFENLGRAFGLSRKRLFRMRDDLAGIVGVHGGRLYYNLTAIHAVLGEAPLGDRLCAWFDEFTGASDPAPVAHRSPRTFVHNLRDGAELCWIALRTTWQYVRIEHRIRAFEARIDAYAEAAAPERLHALDVLSLRTLLRRFRDTRLRQWTDASLADAGAMVCYGVSKALVRKCVDSDEHAASVHHDLLKGLSGLKSAQPVEALWQLARFVCEDQALQRLFAQSDAAGILERIRADPRFDEFARRFDAYLDDWGFRCSGELMLTVPSFQERPAELLDILRCYVEQAQAAPETKLAQQKASREATTRTLLLAARTRPLIKRLPWPSLATLLRPAIRATQGSIGLRERARLKQALLYSRLRRVVLEIGERLAERCVLAAPGDVFYLTLGELDELLSGHAMFPDDVDGIVAVRRRAHERFAALRPADVLVAPPGEYPSTCAAPSPRSDAADLIVGTSVCGGKIVGRARVLTDVAQTSSVRRGEVLITRQTDPGWAPAFALIGGLVLERGGMLSHGAILAREYGIPTVVGVQDAATRIASGRTVQVDGDLGIVRLLDD